MLPGRKYKPEDLLVILRQHVWWVLVPFAIISAVTAAVARKLPDRYSSESLVRVVPQQVPTDYVKQLQTESIGDRLQAMQAQVLSRSRLERIIEEHNLYSEERRKGIMEDVIQQMRDDITLQVSKGDVFRVGYTGANRITVQKVASELATAFVNASASDQENLAVDTNQFMDAQVEDARRILAETEKKLEDYKGKYAGQLPTQLGGNLQAQVNVQTQIREIAQNINQAQDRRLLLEGQVKDLESQAPGADAQTAAPEMAPGGDRVQGGTTAQQLAYAKEQLALLQKKYKDVQPDVKQMKQIVAELQAKADVEALSRPVSADPISVSPIESARQRRLKDLNAQIAEIDRQVAQAREEEKRLRAENDNLQKRIDAVPARESEMTELMRDYQSYTQSYNGLLAKRQESKLAANLQRGQEGEQFKVIDPARIPERPTSPNRPLINLGGMVAGLVVGLALVGLLEYRDQSFKTDDEIIGLLALPVLAVVPVMESYSERRRARRHRLYLGVGLGSTVVGCLAVLIYTFVR